MQFFLFAMPAVKTSYAIINMTNENIKLTIMPKIEVRRGMPAKPIDYYKDGKRELTLLILECERKEKELLIIDIEAPAPFYQSRKNTTIILSLHNFQITGVNPVEIIHYLVNDITIYDMQDNVVLTYSDITENSIDKRGGIIITQEMVDTGRNKYRDTQTE
jgi:hypothetical protein